MLRLAISHGKSYKEDIQNTILHAANESIIYQKTKTKPIYWRQKI